MKKIDIIKFLTMCIPIFYNLTDQGLFPKYSQYIPFVFIVIFMIISKERVIVEHSVKVVVLLIFLTYVCIPIISFNFGKNNIVFESLYMGLNIIFVLALISLRVYSKKYGDKCIIKSLMIGNSFGIIYPLLCNFNDFNYNNLRWIGSSSRASRANFGYSHANFAAMFIFFNILIIYIYFFIIGNNKKVFATILINLFIIIMLFTASRTAILCVGIFFLLEVMKNILQRLNWAQRIFIICLSGITLIILIIAINIYNVRIELDLTSLYVRISNLRNNINILNKNSFLLGNGGVNISSMHNYITNMRISDNWYITTILMYGSVGLMIMIINIIYILRSSIKNKNYFMVNLIITFIIYSTMENIMFVPGVLISMLFWGIIFIYL